MSINVNHPKTFADPIIHSHQYYLRYRNSQKIEMQPRHPTKLSKIRQWNKGQYKDFMYTISYSI